MKEKQLTLVGHLESYLGPIAQGWSETQDGTKLPFQLIMFRERPIKSAITFSTLGLSNTILEQPGGSKIRQEVIFTCHDRYANWEIPSLLAIVGEDLLTEQEPFLRGQVIGPAGPLFDHSSLEALYCASPVYFPGGLHEYHGSESPTALVWLVPISRTEAEFIGREGWPSFEDILEQEAPDLLDLQRDTVSLPADT